jgi:hypothetical protein
MGKIVLVNAQVIVNSVDLSTWCDQVTLEETFADIDTTAFGQGAKTRVAGLGDHKFTAEFQQDYAGGAVDATISPLVGLTTSVTIKGVNAATSTTNPAYTFTVLVTQYKPLDGKVGDLSKTAVAWPISGTVTRATS